MSGGGGLRNHRKGGPEVSCQSPSCMECSGDFLHSAEKYRTGPNQAGR
uniref:Uncharacterized protein n=1 Tax=Anguilla anguilla TaxID=7936 RepID=A0A0E9SYM7_ANGAN